MAFLAPPALMPAAAGCGGSGGNGESDADVAVDGQDAIRDPDVYEDDSPDADVPPDPGADGDADDSTPQDSDISDTTGEPDAPADTYMAVGFNGNYCVVIPEWSMVVVRLGVDGTSVSAHDWSAFFRLLGESL